MRELFKEHYGFSAEELTGMWGECTFVFDTNILLALYRLPKAGRDDLLTTLQVIQDRIWIPYHVALEFQRNRPVVIDEQKHIWSRVTADLDKSLATLRKDIGTHHIVQAEEMLSNVSAVFEAYKVKLTELEKEQAGVNDHDSIREQLDKLLIGRIGPKPTQPAVDAIEKEGVERFTRNAPPGFSDAKKQDNFIAQGIKYQAKFGDLHIWKQVLQEIERSALKALVFVTNDQKEDWWFEVRGKRVGPSPELKSEAFIAGADRFHMYSLSQFLIFAKETITDKISQEAIDQAEDLSEAVPALELVPRLIIRLSNTASRFQALAEVSRLARRWVGSKSKVRLSGNRLIVVSLPDDIEIGSAPNFSTIAGVDSVSWDALPDPSETPKTMSRTTIRVLLDEGTHWPPLRESISTLAEECFGGAADVRFEEDRARISVFCHHRDASRSEFLAKLSGLSGVASVSAIDTKVRVRERLV
ncbi:PIN-like domain-containing protein [Shinella sp.]|uniref:PIN-like domain-containing protein n=1 Tax=Shinella sp. TaxID=1870904 RepID=UPI0029B34AAC|nr:PIN-like domain-containing protein [Shinella sp.]MDX3977174.1 PIN domain-containing protein [Shinella sp.]